jgi:hypothetical protein
LKPRLSSVDLPRWREAKTLIRIHPRFPWFVPGLVSWVGTGVTPVLSSRPPHRPRKPPSVLSPFAQLRCYLDWGEVDPLLRERYPPVLAPTGSCVTPLGLSLPSAFSLVPRVFAGCTQSLLPTGASRRYLCEPFLRCPSPYPGGPAECFCLVLPQRHRPSPL